jgi:hypothetical protein
MQKGMQAYQGGKCFIATELYGSDACEVALLRRFRDQVLLRTHLGTAFVTAYYRVAPKIVPLVRRSNMVRFVLRTLVTCSVFLVRRTPVGAAAGAAPDRIHGGECSTSISSRGAAK